MDRELFSLALQGTLRKKRSSLLVFLVLLFSFAFAIVSLSLMGSITKTNADFRMDTYGEWYYAIPAGLDEDAAFLQTMRGVKSYGTMHNYGTLGGVGFGTVDAGMIEAGRLKVDQGHWPVAEGEIAMEADTLSLLGYDYTLGQEITVSISVPCENEEIQVQQSFTLCGIVHEFHSLWSMNQNRDSRLLVSAIVTEETAGKVLDAAAEEATEQGLTTQPDRALPQYFITLKENSKDTVQQSKEVLTDYMRETRDYYWGDRSPSTNDVILEAPSGSVSNGTYLAMIAAVALAAVLCVYLMQLPSSIHSFATLRSLGISRPQLFQLLLTETLLLLVPAMVLGVPCGAAFTWLALRLLAFSDGAFIKVAIPYGQIFGLVLLWLAVVAAAQLVIFSVAVKVPLNGRFQLQKGKAWLVRHVRSGLIAVVLCVFGMSLILPEIESSYPKKMREVYAGLPHYDFYRSVYDPVSQKPLNKIIPERAVQELRSMQGLKQTVAYSYVDIGLSFPGMEERSTTLLVVPDDEWGVLELGEQREAFQNGELVLLCFPDFDVPDEELSDFDWPPEDWYYLLPNEELSNREYVLPDGVVELYFYDAGRTLMAQTEAKTSVRRFSAGTIYCRRSLLDPYLIVCSDTYLKNVLASMDPDSNWNPPSDRQTRSGIKQTEFIAGAEYGYWNVYSRADAYVSTDLTDNLVASFCKKQDLMLLNNRQFVMANEQEQVQKIVMYYAMGACIALMALLVLAGALSLETEQEMQAFCTLRAIGMSRRQMWARVFTKALGRSVLAGVGGWGIYLVYTTIHRIYQYANPGDSGAEPVMLGPWEALKNALSFYNIDVYTVLRLGGVCVAVSFVVMLLAKRHVGKGEIIR